MNRTSEIKLREAFEHRILHGLLCEWETALWVLEPAERRLLRKPLICIRDMENRWGYWAGPNNELGLSRDLVLNYSWDCVREVFLHEIAHQFSDQVLGAREERPHGPAFQQACRRLRANPNASGRFRLLRDRVADETADMDSRILRRIRKLLSLAQSCNSHEAESAMAKAHDLIAKYNVDLGRENFHRSYTSVFAGKPALRHRREEYHLAHLLQEHYFVHALWVSTYVLEKDKMGHVLEISGTLQNIRIAGYVYDFVKNYIASQWETFNHDKGLNIYRRTDFAVGIIEGFRSKLQKKQKRRKSATDCGSLVPLEDPLLKDYVAYKYPHTVTVSRNVYSQDETVWSAGVRAGKRMILSKGVTQSCPVPKLIA